MTRSGSARVRNSELLECQPDRDMHFGAVAMSSMVLSPAVAAATTAAAAAAAPACLLRCCWTTTPACLPEIGEVEQLWTTHLQVRVSCAFLTN